MGEITMVRCEHIEEGGRPEKFFFQLGERSALILCFECFQRLEGKILGDLIVEGVSRSVNNRDG
jgi:hypothetical protein